MSVVSELDVENALCDLFAALGWTVTTGAALAPERANQREVFLLPRLRAALDVLNPDAPEEVRDDALRELTRDRTSMELVNANREVHTLLVDGFKGAHTAPDGTVSQHALRYLDWDAAAKNHFLLARQLTVTGPAGDFRPDLVGFVNGIPLVVGELKDAAVGLDTALTKNLTPYRSEIPQLFVPNAVVLLSNFTDTRVGTFTSTVLEHFARYTRLSEDDPRNEDAATTLRAVFTPGHLLDYVENFILYEQGDHGLRKLLAQNHQRLGVNAAVARIAHYGSMVDAGVTEKALEQPRKLGVYWHTQGSGKSYSMAFLVRKVLRRVPGDWSFVVVTDREDLDAQIHANFVRTGVTSNKKGLRAKSAKELKKLLGGNERVVFTLIQKFRPEEGVTAMAVLSKSPRVLVLADEAHRSQYATFSTAMRTALPGAAFMAFTGTPLIEADTTTREKFGDYVSRYPFFQAIEDGATVPLFYEAAVADLQLSPTDLDAAMERASKDESLSDDDRKAIEQHFSREYILLTRSKRLEKVAEHLVDHLFGFAPSHEGHGGVPRPPDHPSPRAARRGRAREAPHGDPGSHRGAGALRDVSARGDGARAGGARRARMGGGGLAHPGRRRRAREAAPAPRAGGGGLCEGAGGAAREDGPGRRRRGARGAAGRGRGGGEARGAGGRERPRARGGACLGGEGPRRGARGAGDALQRPRRPAAPGLRVLDVDHGLRRAALRGGVPRPPDGEPHADADHRAGQPGLSGQGLRAGDGLRRGAAQPREGLQGLRERARGARASTARWWTSSRRSSGSPQPSPTRSPSARGWACHSPSSRGETARSASRR
jgi:HsdR family type I site-specific deoxyribonuclease